MTKTQTDPTPTLITSTLEFPADETTSGFVVTHAETGTGVDFARYISETVGPHATLTVHYVTNVETKRNGSDNGLHIILRRSNGETIQIVTFDEETAS
jgi:hypothetical protein